MVTPNVEPGDVIVLIMRSAARIREPPVLKDRLAVAPSVVYQAIIARVVKSAWKIVVLHQYSYQRVGGW